MYTQVNDLIVCKKSKNFYALDVAKLTGMQLDYIPVLICTKDDEYLYLE